MLNETRIISEEEAQELSFNKGMEVVSKDTFWSKWKKGIEMISPLQSLEAQQKSNYVMLFGLVAGMIVMLWKLKDFWWIELILGASLFNQSFTMLGIWQRIKIIKKLEDGE